MENRITAMQQDNNRRLTEMQQVVDEKLQKTLENRITKSFELVQKQLEEVYKGLGEMQTVAAGVTDLKKVLSNVKTRGSWERSSWAPFWKKYFLPNSTPGM